MNIYIEDNLAAEYGISENFTPRDIYFAMSKYYKRKEIKDTVDYLVTDFYDPDDIDEGFECKVVKNLSSDEYEDLVDKILNSVEQLEQHGTEYDNLIFDETRAEIQYLAYLEKAKQKNESR